MMEFLPKLLPTWHDIALQKLVRNKRTEIQRLRTIYPPSHGGIGIDVNCDLVCGNSSDSIEVIISSTNCALPFIPLKTINSLEDPCLEALKKEKFQFNKFSYLLSKSSRSTFGNKTSLSNLKNLKQQLQRCLENDETSVNSIKIRETLLYLAENKPKRFAFPKHNSAYAGGTLAVLKSSNNLNLLHSSCDDLCKLCITPLKNSNDMHFIADLDGQRIVDVGKENILQIEPALNDFCCVRQKNGFHLIDVTNKTVSSKNIHDSSLQHIAVSLYNPMEVLSIYEKGVMKLLNMETRKTLSISKDLCDDPSLLYPSWSCSFGSHLFSVLCMNERKMYSFDCREKIHVKNELFNVVNPSCHVTEELIGMRSWNKNPFQHLITSTHHLIICDERYPKKPVMFWNHTLKDPPVYIESADLSSEVSCVLIATQKTQELAAFLFSHGTNIQPVSLSPPLLLSSPTDCVKSLKLHSYSVDEKFSSRMSYPLTGIGLVPKENEIAFAALQCTSLGDIFYQDFKQSYASEKTYRVGTGCVLTPPEKILPHVEKWISGSNDRSGEAAEDLHEDVLTFRVNVEKLLSPVKKISSNCALCRSRNLAEEEELVLSENCPKCNLTSMESEKFCKIEANLGTVIGPVSEDHSFFDLDLEYFSEFEDTYSKRILSVWLETEDFEASQAAGDQSTFSNDLLEMSY